jgi:hypothetical protein
MRLFDTHAYQDEAFDSDRAAVISERATRAWPG